MHTIFLNCYGLCQTFSGAVVGDVTGHVDGFTVNHQVPHATHKVTVSYGEILWKVGHPTKQKRPSEIQRPEEGKQNFDLFANKLSKLMASKAHNLVSYPAFYYLKPKVYFGFNAYASICVDSVCISTICTIFHVP